MRSLTAKRVAVSAVFGVLALVGLARVSLANEEQLISDARQTVATYKRADPGLETFFQRAAGYVVFPGIGKGGLGIGGAHGTGVLFQNGAPVGKVSLNQVTIGAQAGGQEFSEVIFFETPQAVAELKQGKANFSAQVSAVALKSGASANAKYRNGVVVFTATKGGLMAEAAIGGQKFSFEPFATLR